MDCKSKPFTQIGREYKITSRELKKKLGIEGDITNIILFKGRSQNDTECGISADSDIWEIMTTEKKEKT